MLTKKLAIILFGCIMSFGQVSFSAGFESTERMKSTAKAFLIKNIQTEPGESIEIQVNQSNSPLRVTACSKEIEAAFPINSNMEKISAVELACNDSQPWHILVPVEVQIFSKVIIAKKTIATKEPINEDDLDFALYDKNRLYSGYFTRKEDVIGTEAKRVIPAGTILTKKNVQLPLIVHRNQTINLIVQNNTVTVSMQGIAKSDGALNSVIKVFNPSSKRTMDAVVISSDKAKISA